MAVLPERMNRLNRDNSRDSLKTVEDYIAYMGERIEFSMRNLTKQVGEGGASSAELALQIKQLEGEISALSSTISSLEGTVTGLAGRMQNIAEQVNGLEERVAELEGTTEEGG